METGESAAAGEGQESGMLFCGQRIGDEWHDRGQTAGSRSIGSEPGSSAGRKIDSGHEFEHS